MKQFRFQSSRLEFDSKTLWATLSAREQEIALLVAQGLRTRQIAQELHLSPQTVNSHLKTIFTKLQIHSRVELANVVRECAD